MAHQHRILTRQLTILKPLLENEGYTFHNHIRGLQKQQIDHNFLDSEFYQLHFVDKIKGNRFETHSLITGSYRNVPFRSIDVNCYYVVNTGKSSHRVTLFQGRIYSLNLKTVPDFTLTVREEGNRFTSKPKKLESVEYESIEFNKKFNVYTTHPELAFTYIKPQTMEKILRLEKMFQGKLLLSIHDGQVYFGKYDNRLHFKIKSATTEADMKHMITEEQEFVSQLYDIFDNILNKTN